MYEQDDISISLDKAYYGPVGRCIYCDGDNGGKKLSSEHIFPFFIGGNVELLESSCDKCAGETSFLDGHCAYKIFDSIRVHKGIQTRRPKKRPTHFPVIFNTEQGDVVREVPVEDQPYALALPHFPEPGLIRNAPPNGGIVPLTWSLLTNDDFAERAEKMRKPGDRGWTFKREWNNDVFARWLAKTALSAAVGILGYNAKHSWLPNIILGNDKNTDILIGSEPKAEAGIVVTKHPPVADRDSHRVTFTHYQGEKNVILGALINLFRGHGDPDTYVVIVGPGMPGPIEDFIRPSRATAEPKTHEPK